MLTAKNNISLISGQAFREQGLVHAKEHVEMAKITFATEDPTMVPMLTSLMETKTPMMEVISSESAQAAGSMIAPDISGEISNFSMNTSMLGRKK